jgi:hypothetical protein
MTVADSSSAIAFLSVWRQALVEQKKIVSLGDATFSVRRTTKTRLAQIDFELDGVEFRGLEQNPRTKSRWAKWRAKAQKSCSFCERAGTSAWSPMES